jgi:hypothetical protein
MIKKIIFYILPIEVLNDFFFTNDEHRIVSEQGWIKLNKNKL